MVHGTIMGHVTEATYLGDIISHDGKNTKNVNSRVAKGLGIITDIMNMLGKKARKTDRNFGGVEEGRIGPVEE